MTSLLPVSLPTPTSIGCGAYTFVASTPRRGARFRDTVLVVPITGDLDAGTAPDFASWLSPLAGHGCHLVLDLSGVTFIGSAGLTLFGQLQHETAAAGGSVHLVSVPAPCLRVIAAAGLHAMLDTHAPAGVRHPTAPTHEPGAEGQPDREYVGRTTPDDDIDVARNGAEARSERHRLGTTS
jgi:anti-sigma B factor antagonist